MHLKVIDHAPHIETLTGKFDDWYEAIERFQNHIRRNVTDEEY